MSDIFFEVKEALEKERLQKLWRVLKYPIFSLCGLIVVSVGVYEYMQSRALKKSAADQSVYTMALRDLKEKDVNSCLNRLNYIISNGSDGYVQLALMLKAAILNSMRDYEKRDEVYKFLSSKYKNFTSFIVCCSVLSNMSELKKPEVLNKIKSIASNKSDPMSVFAMQLLLFWDMFNGLNDDAKAKLIELRKSINTNHYLLGILSSIVGG